MVYAYLCCKSLLLKSEGWHYGYMYIGDAYIYIFALSVEDDT